jgi:hypothetical protein
MRKRRNALFLVLGLSVPLAVATSCSSTKTDASSPISLDLVSGPPKTVLIDNGQSGPSIGDVDAFSADVTRGGKPFGTLYGTKTLVALAGEHGVPAGLGLFQNQLTFVLPDGTITVTGVQYYQLDTSNQAAVDAVRNLPTVRSVVGGTGAYAGARGVMTTSLDHAGSREQHFAFTVQPAIVADGRTGSFLN